MKNLIIVAGSSNTGKTITTNLVIQKLISDGYEVTSKYEDIKYIGEFWEYLDVDPKGGYAILEKNGQRILVVTYGDSEKDVRDIFDGINLNEFYSIVCCSRAAKGRRVFNYFYNKIAEIDLKNTNVIPIYKNLVAHYDKRDIENESLANLICNFIIN